MNREPTADDDAENRTASDAITRRRALAAGGAVALAGLAGCTAYDVATGDEPAEFAAGTATVADATLSESGYELNDVTDETITREVEVAGRTREVRVTNTVAEYDKAVELFGERYQAAVFAAVATSSAVQPARPASATAPPAASARRRVYGPASADSALSSAVGSRVMASGRVGGGTYFVFAGPRCRVADTTRPRRPRRPRDNASPGNAEFARFLRPRAVGEGR